MSISDHLLSALDTLGYAADTPRALLFGALGGAPGTRLGGRELLEKYGALGPNQEGLDAGDVAGFGLEAVLDPLNLLFGAGMGKKALQALRIKKANAASQALRAGGAMPAELLAKTHPDLLSNVRRVVPERQDAVINALKGAGVPDDLAQEVELTARMASRAGEDIPAALKQAHAAQLSPRQMELAIEEAQGLHENVTGPFVHVGNEYQQKFLHSENPLFTDKMQQPSTVKKITDSIPGTVRERVGRTRPPLKNSRKALAARMFSAEDMTGISREQVRRVLRTHAFDREAARKYAEKLGVNIEDITGKDVYRDIPARMSAQRALGEGPVQGHVLRDMVETMMQGSDELPQSPVFNAGYDAIVEKQGRGLRATPGKESQLYSAQIAPALQQLPNIKKHLAALLAFNAAKGADGIRED